jgi:hypothetical protein
MMRWPWTLLIVGAVVCFILFMVASPNSDPNALCNFCSGSGQGADCPRNDMAARAQCLIDRAYE